MLREIILLAIGAVFGLGATMTAAVAPTYLPNLPPWAVHWLFWGGIALMAIMAFDGMSLALFERQTTMTAICANVALFFIAATAISYFSPPSGEKELIRGSLFVSCSMVGYLPAAIPVSGKIKVFQISQQGLENNKNFLTSTEWVGTVGEKVKWPPNMRLNASECEIINDTKSVLLDVAIILPIDFSKDPTHAEKKEIRNLILNRIDPGPNNKIILYFTNQSEQLVSFQIPATATAKILGEDFRRKIVIRQSANILGPLVVLWNMPPLPEPNKNANTPR